MMAIVDDDLATYQRLGDELIRYATALVGPSDAADIVIDGVLSAFASPRWPTVTNQRAYLYRSVFHRAASLRRSNVRRARREALAAPRELLVVPEPSIDAHRALQKLSRQQRAVVHLTYWADLTPIEIAEMLAVSEGTVRKQLARAREHLRRILDEH